jgi:hypothetical protein
LRHYLACFSRSLAALRVAVQLFVFAWNRRQLARHHHPSIASRLLNLYAHDICHPRTGISREIATETAVFGLALAGLLYFATHSVYNE